MFQLLIMSLLVTLCLERSPVNLTWSATDRYVAIMPERISSNEARRFRWRWLSDKQGRLLATLWSVADSTTGIVLKCTQRMRSGCTPWDDWFKSNPLVADEQNSAIHSCGEFAIIKVKWNTTKTARREGSGSIPDTTSIASVIQSTQLGLYFENSPRFIW